MNSPSNSKLRGNEKIGGTTYTLAMINKGVQEQAQKKRKVKITTSEKKVYTYRAQSARPSAVIRYEEVRFTEEEEPLTSKKAQLKSN